MKQGLKLRSGIIKFHEKHYSSNHMKLVVLGSESMDEMELWPWSADDMCKQIFAKSVVDTRSMDIYFPFLDDEHPYESQPSRYISHLIGHEGPGSIFAYT
ncbi:hypothetical protein BJX96DRAFT_180228 [Aspergillus floccosus]